MDAAAELGRNPVSKHQIQPEYRDEQADAGRDCRNRLARPNSQARTNADRGILIFPVQLTTSRIGNLTRLIHTLAICVTIHTCIHTYMVQKHGLESCCCCFSHSAYWLPTEKTTQHGGQSRSWSAEQGKEDKRKVWQHTPPPHPPHCSFGENK